MIARIESRSQGIGNKGQVQPREVRDMHVGRPFGASAKSWTYPVGKQVGPRASHAQTGRKWREKWETKAKLRGLTAARNRI